MIDLIVYFSSPTENTKRFVEKLNVESVRIPISPKDDIPITERPYVLVIPTYGGGASIMGRKSRPILPQIKKFLSIDRNAENLRGVIAGGNSNFGSDYGKAGDVIQKKFHVPYVYRFELMGNEEDVRIVKEGLKNMKATAE